MLYYYTAKRIFCKEIIRTIEVPKFRKNMPIGEKGIKL